MKEHPGMHQATAHWSVFNSRMANPQVPAFSPHPLSTSLPDDLPKALKGPQELTAGNSNTREQLRHTQEGAGAGWSLGAF